MTPNAAHSNPVVRMWPYIRSSVLPKNVLYWKSRSIHFLVSRSTMFVTVTAR